MHRHYLFFIFFSMMILLVTSCKKEDTGSSKYVYAGKYDSSFFYYEWQPPYKVPIAWDSLNLYGSGTAMLDINQDGIPDLQVKVEAFNNDNFYLLGGDYPDPFPYCGISSLNGIQMAFHKISFGLGHGSSASIFYIYCLNEGEQINMLNGWRTEGKLWQSTPGAHFLIPDSEWHYASSTHYLALKLGERRYGWIELDTSDPEQGPVFIRIAIN